MTIRRVLKYLFLTLLAGVLVVFVAKLTMVAYATGRASAYSEEDSKLFFQMYEIMGKQQGRFRTITEPDDAPFSKEDLAENFLEIALQFEKRQNEDGTPIFFPLKKWNVPIRYAVLGEGVLESDKEEIAQVMARISHLTGVQVASVDTQQDANFQYVVIGKSLRRQIVNKSVMENVKNTLSLSSPDKVRAANKDTRVAMTLKSPCHVLPTWNDSSIQAIQIRMKAELPQSIRLMCIHEEISQAFGLPDDSDHIRPTIFNDDAEFSLLTEHDEVLLQILYDERLKPGMTVEEVRPLLPEIIEDIWRE